MAMKIMAVISLRISITKHTACGKRFIYMINYFSRCFGTRGQWVEIKLIDLHHQCLRSHGHGFPEQPTDRKATLSDERWRIWSGTQLNSWAENGTLTLLMKMNIFLCVSYPRKAVADVIDRPQCPWKRVWSSELHRYRQLLPFGW